MIFYGERNPAPNPRRVRIFLAEKRASIPTESLDLGAICLKTGKFSHSFEYMFVCSKCSDLILNL